MQLSRRTWQGIALGLLATALFIAAFGVLIAVSDAKPTEEIIDPIALNGQVSRGCFFGPAFAMIFLAYLAFTASRRRDKKLRLFEIVAGLMAALGLALVLFGVAIAPIPVKTIPSTRYWAWSRSACSRALG